MLIEVIGTCPKTPKTCFGLRGPLGLNTLEVLQVCHLTTLIAIQIDRKLSRSRWHNENQPTSVESWKMATGPHHDDVNFTRHNDGKRRCEAHQLSKHRGPHHSNRVVGPMPETCEYLNPSPPLRSAFPAQSCAFRSRNLERKISSSRVQVCLSPLAQSLALCFVLIMSSLKASSCKLFPGVEHVLGLFATGG